MTGLRVAGVGAGYFSQFHYDAWRRLPGVELVGICNRSRDKAAAIAATAGGPPVFDDLARMLDTARPDLLDIITPPETHVDTIGLCADRGIAAVCQKPFTPTYGQAEAAVARAETAGISLMIHENYRWQPWYRELRRLLDAGRLGTVRNITFRLRPGDGQGPQAYLDRQPYFQTMPRFLIHETAIHLIDTFRYLLGEVTGVFARLRTLNPAIAGEDAGLVVFDFQDGAAGLFDGNRLIDHAATDRRRTFGDLWIEGDGAVARLDGDGGLHLRDHGSNTENPWPYAWENKGFGGDSIYAMQAHFVDHLVRGTPVENSGRDYLRNIVVEDAVYRSSAEGRYIAL